MVPKCILGVLLTNFLNSGQCCGSGMFIPDHGSNFFIAERGSGFFLIQDPDPDPGVKKHWIPNPGSATLNMVVSSVYYCRCIPEAYYQLVTVWDNVSSISPRTNSKTIYGFRTALLPRRHLRKPRLVGIPVSNLLQICQKSI